MNLTEIVANVSCEDVINAISENFTNSLRTKPMIHNNDRELDSSSLQKLYEKHKSSNWVLGNTPKFPSPMGEEILLGWMLFTFSRKQSENNEN